MPEDCCGRPDRPKRLNGCLHVARVCVSVLATQCYEFVDELKEIARIVQYTLCPTNDEWKSR